MKCDMQYTAIFYNAKNYNIKHCLKLTSLFEWFVPFHFKFIWKIITSLIIYVSWVESLEEITLQRFLRGSWFFSTGAVLIIGIFWYTLTLQLCIFIGFCRGSIFCWKSVCWKIENVGFRILGSFGGMKCYLCKKCFMLQLSIALVIACSCLSSPLL